jgi:hypothetical protein
VIGAGIPADWLDGEGVAIAGLRTPHGVLGYTLRRDHARVLFKLSPGLRVPTGGVVLRLPAELSGGEARIDGAPASWREGEVRIDHAPADVVIQVP